MQLRSFLRIFAFMRKDINTLFRQFKLFFNKCFFSKIFMGIYSSESGSSEFFVGIQFCEIHQTQENTYKFVTVEISLSKSLVLMVWSNPFLWSNYWRGEWEVERSFFLPPLSSKLSVHLQTSVYLFDFLCHGKHLNFVGISTCGLHDK